jgi:hypothetical protein
VFNAFRRSYGRYRSAEALPDATLRDMIRNWAPGVERTRTGYLKNISLQAAGGSSSSRVAVPVAAAVSSSSSSKQGSSETEGSSLLDSITQAAAAAAQESTAAADKGSGSS